MRPLLLLLSSTALAGTFVDPIAKALEASAHPHPLLTGQPVTVTSRPPPNARSQPCDQEVPDDRAELRADADQICFEREWTRVTSITARDPDPQRWESWFSTEHGETAHFQPEGETWTFTECRSEEGTYKIFRESWKACVANGGVLTEADRKLALHTKVPPVGLNRALWEIELTSH